MDETVIVIMLKNKETGFLETEIGSYNISDEEGFIYNIYAVSEPSAACAVQGEAISVHMRLSVERDLEDWEFSAVLDYYDTEPLLEICQSVGEEDAGYNPVWQVVFGFDESREIMENKISAILAIHKKELESVYEAIAGLGEEYK